MASRVTARIKGVFQRANAALGFPFLRAVRPRATWNLPAGFYYEKSTDTVRSAAGVVLPNPQSYWVSDTIYIVPAGRGSDLRQLIAGGLVPAGSVAVNVLAPDIVTVANAHAIEYSGKWWNVNGINNFPQGTDSVWAQVILQRRE